MAGVSFCPSATGARTLSAASTGREGEKPREAVEDVFRRTEIRAPPDGTVVDLQVHTPGGVITPGERLHDIVPSCDRLVVEARVDLPPDIPGGPSAVNWSHVVAPRSRQGLVGNSSRSWRSDSFFPGEATRSGAPPSAVLPVHFSPHFPSNPDIPCHERAILL